VKIELDPVALDELAVRHDTVSAAILIGNALLRAASASARLDLDDMTVLRDQPLQRLEWCLTQLGVRATTLAARSDDLRRRALLVAALGDLESTFAFGGTARQLMVRAVNVAPTAAWSHSPPLFPTLLMTVPPLVGPPDVLPTNSLSTTVADMAGELEEELDVQLRRGDGLMSGAVGFGVDRINDLLSFGEEVFDDVVDIAATLAVVIETGWNALADEIASFVDGCELAWASIDFQLHRPLADYTPSGPIPVPRGAPLEVAESWLHGELSAFGTIEFDGSFEVTEFPNGVVEVEFRDQQLIGGEVGEGSSVQEGGDIGVFAGHDRSVVLMFASRAEADVFLRLVQNELSNPSLATLKVVNHGGTTGSALTALVTEIYKGSPASDTHAVRVAFSGAATVSAGLGFAGAAVTATVNNGYDSGADHQVQRIEARIDVSAGASNGVGALASGGVIECDLKLVGDPGDASSATFDLALELDGQASFDAFAQQFPSVAASHDVIAAFSSGCGVRLTIHLAETFVAGSAANDVADAMLSVPQTAGAMAPLLISLMSTKSVTVDLFTTTTTSTDLGGSVATEVGSFGAELAQRSRHNDRHLARMTTTLGSLFS